MVAAALGGADEQLALEAGGAQILLQPAQVILHQRLQRGVDGRGGGAAIFAHHRHEAVRQGVGHARQQFVQQFAEALFVRRIGDRPQEAHRNGFKAAAAEFRDDLARARLVEGGGDRAVGADALADLEGVTPRDIGVGIVLREVVRIELAAFLQQQHIRKAGRRHEGGAGDRLGHDGVGGPRRAVDQHLGRRQQFFQRDAELHRRRLDGLAHAEEDAVARRQRLADGQRAGFVAHDHIRESAAGIDGNAILHGSLRRYRAGEPATGIVSMPPAPCFPQRKPDADRHGAPGRGRPCSDRHLFLSRLLSIVVNAHGR